MVNCIPNKGVVLWEERQQAPTPARGDGSTWHRVFLGKAWAPASQHPCLQLRVPDPPPGAVTRMKTRAYSSQAHQLLRPHAGLPCRPWQTPPTTGGQTQPTARLSQTPTGWEKPAGQEDRFAPRFIVSP